MPPPRDVYPHFDRPYAKPNGKPWHLDARPHQNQTNNLKRSFSERHSLYDNTSGPNPRVLTQASVRSSSGAPPLSPTNQFRVGPFPHVPSRGPEQSIERRVRSPPDEIDRQTELFTNGNDHSYHQSSPRRFTPISQPLPKRSHVPITSTSPIVQASQSPVLPQRSPAQEPPPMSPDQSVSPKPLSASRTEASPGPVESPVEPADEVPKVPLVLSEFQAYLQKEESQLFTDYYTSASTCMQRANHMSDVDKLENYTKHVSLSYTSPFSSLTSIKRDETSTARSKGAPDVQLVQHIFRDAHPKSTEHAYTYPVHKFTAPAYQIPGYTHYISSKRNALVEGDKQRTFLPYLGETEDFDDDYQTLETKVLENLQKANVLHQNEEFAKPWIMRIDRILADLGTSTAAVLRFLIDDSITEPPSEMPSEYLEVFDGRQDWIVDGFYEAEDDIDVTRDQTTDKPKRPQKQWRVALENLPAINGHEIAAAAMACHVFMDVSGFSMFDVVRLTPIAAEACQEMLGDSVPDSEALSLQAYIDQTCLICKTHQCSGHGEFSDDDDGDRQRVPMTSQFDSNAIYEKAEEALDTRDLSKELDLRLVLGKGKDDKIEGQPWTLFNDDPPGIKDNELCSLACFWDKSKRDPNCATVTWPKHDEELLRTFGPAFTSHRRGACALSRMGIFTQSCVEIFYKLVNMSATPEDGEAAKIAEGQKHPNKSWRWWSDNTDTWRHDKREPFRPCSHVGKCKNNPDCTCNQQRISCEKSCNCPSVCPRRFRGCRCHAKDRVCTSQEGCDCRALNRECDPDLCFDCGADKVLDPVNRYDEKMVRNKCGNVAIQRSVPKRTQIGQSKLLSAGGVVGWGLFMGEEARKGDYLGEYIGEIVNLEESEQRGIIYNAMNLSYLFDLNSKQVLDSTPIGNKLRYINHQGDEFTNCQAKVMFCSGVQRIAIFCTKNIKLGEELLFNYGDGFANKIDMIKMLKDGSVVIEKARKGADSTGKTSAHKKLPNDIGKSKPGLIHKPGKDSPRTQSPFGGDGALDDDEDLMDIDAADESSAAEEVVDDGNDDDEEEEEEDVYEGQKTKAKQRRKKTLPGGMTGSDRMRKAWISRYRNLGQLAQAKAQEMKFNKNLGKG